MPVDFVTEAQVASYGQYPENLSDQDLAQYFYLDATARQHIATCRGSANRLGDSSPKFAGSSVQLMINGGVKAKKGNTQIVPETNPGAKRVRGYIL